MPWMVWRLWYHKHATLREIEEWYSLDDVLDANDMLDYADEAQTSKQPTLPVES